MQKTNYLQQYAPAVLRYGIALVVLWFSLQQFIHADQWVAFIPASIVAVTHLAATTIVYLNAIFELVFGTLLAFGWKTRWIALLLALHLFDIMWTVGYGEIGVRDFGLAVAALSIAMYGSDILCIDSAPII
jgi:uncharacterized membrane protein YphA (DoxX/SURF4 family)